MNVPRGKIANFLEPTTVGIVTHLSVNHAPIHAHHRNEFEVHY